MLRSPFKKIAEYTDEYKRFIANSITNQRITKIKLIKNNNHKKNIKISAMEKYLTKISK